jgi:DNA-binding NtrC family response regulator
MKACVVDDDHTARILLGGYLEDRGWVAQLFNHPDTPSEENKTLTEALSDRDIKLLIMDVRFGRDKEGLAKGPKTVEKLVNEGKLLSNCFVLFVSQFGKERIDFDSVEKALNDKKIAFDWLDKPIDFVLLNNILKKVGD